MLFGDGGDDIIKGAGTNTVLSGGSGNDKLYAHDFAGDSNDWQMVYFGGPGHDLIKAGSSEDKIYGGPGDDRIYGGYGSDEIWGGEGDDYIYFENDTVANSKYGEADVHGGPGDDHILAGS